MFRRTPPVRIGGEATDRSRGASLPARLGVAAIAFTASLCVVELTLRWQYGPPARYSFPQEYYEGDAKIGHSLVPNQQSFTLDVPVSTNSHGLRDREYPKKPAPGALRIIAIGDSQTFGLGLPSERTWPKQLETLLNRDRVFRSEWEVINAGLSATDTWQHAIILDRVLEWYDADVVVLAIYVNDVSAEWSPKPASEVTNSTKKRIGYALKRSAVLSLARRAYLRLRHRDLELEILKGERDEPRVDEAWTTVSRSLAEMRDRCASRGLQFVAVILPRRDQVSGQTSYRGYQNRLIEILTADEVPHVDLLDPMMAAYSSIGEQLFIPWDGHHSAEANAVVADRVARLIRDTARVSGRMQR